MADFCRQCSIDNFGFDSRDLAGLGFDPLPEGYGLTALCEDCGPTLVDNQGNCISSFCDKQHGVQEINADN